MIGPVDVDIAEGCLTSDRERCLLEKHFGNGRKIDIQDLRSTLWTCQAFDKYDRRYLVGVHVGTTYQDFNVDGYMELPEWLRSEVLALLNEFAKLQVARQAQRASSIQAAWVGAAKGG